MPQLCPRYATVSAQNIERATTVAWQQPSRRIGPTSFPMDEARADFTRSATATPPPGVSMKSWQSPTPQRERQHEELVGTSRQERSKAEVRVSCGRILPTFGAGSTGELDRDPARSDSAMGRKQRWRDHPRMHGPRQVRVDGRGTARLSGHDGELGQEAGRFPVHPLPGCQPLGPVPGHRPFRSIQRRVPEVRQGSHIYEARHAARG